MPASPLLPQLIHVIHPAERQRYVKWIDMEACEKKTLHLSWFHTVFEHLKNQGFPQEVSMEELKALWQGKFPENRSNFRLMTYLSQDLCRFTENFIAWEKGKTYEDRAQLDLLYSLLERSGARPRMKYKLFLKYYHKIQKSLDPSTARGLDFRYWLSRNQLLTIMTEWELYHKGKRSVRGYKPIDQEESSRIAEQAAMMYILERSLFKIADNGGWGDFEQFALDKIKEDHGIEVPYRQILVQVYQWGAPDSAIPSDTELSAVLDSFPKDIHNLRADLVAMLMITVYNLLSGWEKKAPRLFLAEKRNQMLDMLLEQKVIPMNLDLFLIFVKMKISVLNYRYPRITTYVPESTLRSIAPMIQGIREYLEQQASFMERDFREEAYRIIEIHLAFEEGKDDLVEQLYWKFTIGNAFSLVYEIQARWVYAKSLLISGRHDELSDHLRSTTAFIRAKKKEDNVIQEYLEDLKRSLRHLKRMANEKRLRKYASTYLTNLEKDASVEDKLWLTRMFEKSIR